VSANEIPPGEEGKITVRVKSGSRQGPLRQTVRVQTNVPNQENIILTVTARILVDVAVLPPNLLFFDNRQSVPEITVRNFTESPIEIQKVVSLTEFVKISVSDAVIPAQGTVTVSAELLPETPAGILSNWVELHTNLASMPVISIRAWANLPQ
jgi:hypothetical protein